MVNHLHSFPAFRLLLVGVIFLANVNAASSAPLPSPGPYPEGLAWDGQYLWNADFSSSKIFRIDPATRSIAQEITSPQANPNGLTFDGETLWLAVASGVNSIFRLDSNNGDVLKSFPTPGIYPQGLTWDGQYLWLSDINDKKIYQLSAEDGSIIKSIPTPGSLPYGLAWDGSALWNVDFGTDQIYRLDPANGDVLRSFPAPGVEPRGLTWDGQYLWCADNSAKLIYRIDAATGEYNAVGARVLFDESHEEWAEIENNYEAYARDLRALGYNVNRNSSNVISTELLKTTDVLVIGTAWGEFSSAEIDAIQDFVSNGGGLFLTGLGWSWVSPVLGRTLDNYPMNSISSRFDLRFLDDVIEDPTNFFGSPSEPLFTSMLDHPITYRLTSIGGPISPSSIESTDDAADSVIFGDDDAYSSLEYYQPGSYPPVLVAMRFGAGRLVLLGHEGYLASDDYGGNGTMNRNYYDNSQLGLNIIDWLFSSTACHAIVDRNYNSGEVVSIENPGGCIVIGPDVEVDAGAQVAFNALEVFINPGFLAHDGASVQINSAR